MKDALPNDEEGRLKLMDCLEDKRILKIIQKQLPDEEMKDESGAVYMTVPTAQIIWDLSRKEIADDLLDKFWIIPK